LPHIAQCQEAFCTTLNRQIARESGLIAWHHRAECGIEPVSNPG